MRKFGAGFICWWYNSLGSIPVGWALCNGENGTPNLIDRMIYGAGTTPVGENLGSVNHNHDFTGDNHSHGFARLDGAVTAAPGFDAFPSGIPITGTTDNESSLPPYHALLPIMEL